jgi:NADPH:quinone reductase-like Zn-dependent oxidoreductase
MRAVVHDRYGPPEVLRVDEVESPIPKDGEVLVRVRTTTVNRTDCHVRAADPFLWRFMAGFLRPKWRILGMEFAGEVEAVGASVAGFSVGDHVVGIRAYLNEGFGANAELICANPARLAPKPASATWEEAAALFDGSLAALSGLRAANVDKGRSVLVYGASGSIGTAAVQLARHFDADVTAVCNTKNLELVKSLGADRVLDYTREDFTKSGERYDIVFDAVGKKSFRQCRRSLNSGGIYLPTDGLLNFPLAFVTSRIGDRKVLFAMPRYSKDNLLFVRELVEQGRYRPVIDRTYPFEQVVEATKYVETGQKTGNVILTLDGAGPVGA